MSRMLQLFGLTLMILLLSCSPALAEDKGPMPFYGNAIAAGLGAAITIVGAGLGFGRIGAAALESMARQPEVADKVGQNDDRHRGLA